MMRFLRVLGLSLAVLAVPSLALAQDPAGDAFTAAQTAMGFTGSTVMTTGIGIYGPLLLLGIAFIVSVGLIWTMVKWLRRGSNSS